MKLLRFLYGQNGIKYINVLYSKTVALKTTYCFKLRVTEHEENAVARDVILGVKESISSETDDQCSKLTQIIKIFRDVVKNDVKTAKMIIPI